MGRSLFKEMGLPSRLWGEAIRHAVYILNRLPTRALSGTTPYETWSGKKPCLDHLHVFGCIAHIKIINTYTKKFDDRCRMVVYLGKEASTKAYRLYDPNFGIVYVIRDVVF